MMNGDDVESVDLLASDADSSTIDPRFLSHAQYSWNNGTNSQAAARPAKRSRVAFSPATQTLNALSQSQQMADLNYDKLSQLEYDVVSALVQTKTALPVVDPPRELPIKQSTPQPPVQTRKVDRPSPDSVSPSNEASPEEPERRNIVQINVQTGHIQETHQSLRQAAQRLGFSRHIIASILRGTYKANQYNGWTFRYAETPERPTRRIQQVDAQTGNVLETFPTYTAAAKKTGVDRKIISSVVRGELESIDGWTFRLVPVDTPDDATSQAVDTQTIPPIKKSKAPKYRPKVDGNHAATHPVQDLPESNIQKDTALTLPLNARAIAVDELDADTGAVRQTYQSLTTAAKMSGATRHVISAILKGTSKRWNGLTWRYAADTPSATHAPLQSAFPNDSSDSDPPRECDHPIDETPFHTSIPPNETKGTVSLAAAEKAVEKTDHPVSISQHAPRASNIPVIPLNRAKDPATELDSKATKTKGTENTKNLDVAVVDAPVAMRLMEGELGTTTTLADVPKSLPMKHKNESAKEFCFHPIAVTQKGPMGMVVKKVLTPEAAFDIPYLLSADGHISEYSPHVESLIGNDSLASVLGILAGDYVLLACGEFCPNVSATQPVFYTNCFDTVVEAIKSGNRPITLLAVRPSVKSNENPEKSDHILKEVSAAKNDLLDDSNSVLSMESCTASGGNKRSLKTHGGVRDTGGLGMDNPISDEGPRRNTSGGVGLPNPFDGVAPFCAVCNGQKTIRFVHHAWCPKNEHYLASGAEDIVSKILHGIKVLNCGGCQEEYQSGRRAASKNHSESCRNNQTSLTVNSQKDDKDGRKHGDLVLDSQSICGSAFGDDDSGSLYASPSKAQGPIQILKVSNTSEAPTVQRQNIENHSVCEQQTGDRPDIQRQSTKAVDNNAKTGTLTSKSSKLKSRNTLNTSKNKSIQQNLLGKKGNSSDRPGTSTTDVTSVATKPFVPAKRAATSKSALSRIREPCGTTELLVSDPEDTDNYEKLNVDWEDCDNIWGPDGQMDDDVVVLSTSSNYVCHHESILLADRYEIDPFRSYPRYLRTHSSPEGGYQALLLRRDLFAKRPWGFSCDRHEFGGACLVNNVDPHSPAEACTLLGAGLDKSAPLRVNDMIIAINGKSVGGMTTIGLEIELEQACPELMVIVSRYLFPEDVQNTIARNEQSYLNAFDCEINDDRQLAWIDVGVTAFSSNHRKDVIMGAYEDASRTRNLRLKSPDSVDDSHRANDCILIDPPTSLLLDRSRNVNVNLKGGEPLPTLKVDASSIESLTATESGFVPVQNAKEGAIKRKVSFVNQESGRSARKRIRSISVNRDGGSSSASEDEDTDDGNAWCGCVCGVTHTKSKTHKNIFWIQCDVCLSWYDCSSQCVGFSESEAKCFSSWNCWGCPVPESHCDLPTVEVNRPGRVSISPLFPDSVSQQFTKGLGESHLMNKTEGIVRQTDETEEVFSTGDLVFVTEHGWPGVNNPEGVAKVLKAYLDEDGDQVYDLKYVVGPKVNGVLPEYLRRHTF